MAHERTCDGIRRRDFIQVGAIGGTALTLSNHLAWARDQSRGSSPAQAAIFINLGGGPSHIDTFDPKPEAPEEYRGEFTTIATDVSGIRICEHLPKLAACANRYAILRGVSHTLAAHELGSSYVHTGNRPLASLEFPAFGSVIAHELSGPAELPPFVAVPQTKFGAGYLGVKYAALATNATPRPGKPFAVRGISLDGRVSLAHVDRRTALLRDLDTKFRDMAAGNELVDGLDAFSQQAHTIITSRQARLAFDVSQEEPSFAKPFGDSTFGQSCLLATRLVEAGVRFVTIGFNGWDTHADNFQKLRDTLLPQLDSGLSALLLGLEEKGLLPSTAVLVTGEFGRTPKVNVRAGRDHYPRAMTMLMAGGGIRGGQVIGESDEKGQGPKHEGIRPDDVAASLYKCLGIDHRKEYLTATGRPVMIVRDGEPIAQLFG